jgi:hypothetical protein
VSLLRAASALRAAMAGPLRLDPSWLADAVAGLDAIEARIPKPCPPDCPECAWARDEAVLDWPAPGRVHGVSGRPAIVTRSIARGRRRFGGRPSDLPYLKQATHRKHRRAWRVWAADPERPEPSLRSLTSREVW